MYSIITYANNENFTSSFLNYSSFTSLISVASTSGNMLNTSGDTWYPCLPLI